MLERCFNAEIATVKVDTLLRRMGLFCLHYTRLAMAMHSYGPQRGYRLPCRGHANTMHGYGYWKVVHSEYNAWSSARNPGTAVERAARTPEPARARIHDVCNRAFVDQLCMPTHVHTYTWVLKLKIKRVWKMCVHFTSLHWLQHAIWKFCRQQLNCVFTM